MVSIIPPGKLVYGMQLPIQAQSTFFAEPWEAESGPGELAQITQAADRADFFYVAVCDHVAIPREKAVTMRTTWYDTIATLSWLAAQTQRTHLLSHVFVLAYRAPLVAAKSFCTLDALSGGRVIAGIGAGHVEGEFDVLGVDFARRGPLLDEALVPFEAALREEYQAGDVGVAPRPVQSPRPPIWIGGSAPPAVRRAARYDGWLPQGNPRAAMPALIATLNAERDAAGIAEPCEIGAITEWLYVGDPAWDTGRPTISGTAEALADSLNEFGAMGASHLQVRFPSRSPDELCDQITAFGETVGPLLSR